MACAANSLWAAATAALASGSSIPTPPFAANSSNLARSSASFFSLAAFFASAASADSAALLAVVEMDLA